MSQTSPLSGAVADSAFTSIVASPTADPSTRHPFPSGDRTNEVLLGVITAAVGIHLVAIAFIGFGVPAPEPRPHRTVAPPVVAVMENIKLEEPPPPPPLPAAKETPLAAPSAPEAAPALPTLPPLQPVAAVASTVPAAFGIEVKGPVRLVSDASAASGAIGAQSPTEPISLDNDDTALRDLLLPALSYPLYAKRHRIIGTVVVEFHTSPTGDIQDVRVRQTSGHDVLDEAATDNVRHGHWKGQPGYYLKAFEFSLQ